MLPESQALAWVAAAFGSAVGSFANVCVYRLPRELSLVFPRSRCSRCGMRVAAYDNIPLVSYFLLRGRCRHCGTRYGVRYLLIEALCALVGVVVVGRLGVTLASFYWFSLAVALIIVSAVDLEHKIIPDAISLPGTAVGLVAAAVAQLWGAAWPVTFLEALAGAAGGAFLLWSVLWAYERITGREGIGFGDVKLLALFGANSGIPGVLSSLFYGSLFGSVAGLALMALRRRGFREPIPFGPFLCLGLLAHALGGGRWLNALVVPQDLFDRLQSLF